VIQGDGAEDSTARHRFGDHLRALPGLDVMRLEDESFEAAREKLLRAVDVVDAPGDHIGTDVHLQIVRALERPPCLIGNRNRLLRGRLSRHRFLADRDSTLRARSRAARS